MPTLNNMYRYYHSSPHCTDCYLNFNLLLLNVYTNENRGCFQFPCPVTEENPKYGHESGYYSAWEVCKELNSQQVQNCCEDTVHSTQCVCVLCSRHVEIKVRALVVAAVIDQMQLSVCVGCCRSEKASLDSGSC